MNDAIGPEGLVPSLLLYGISPRCIPASLDEDLSTQRQRHETVKSAREEYQRSSTKLHINAAVRAKVPESAEVIFCIVPAFFWMPSSVIYVVIAEISCRFGS